MDKTKGKWRIRKDPSLLPCPFCGGEAAVIDDRQNPYDDCVSHIECLQCGIKTSVLDGIEKWNRRVDLKAPKTLYKENAKLRKQLENTIKLPFFQKCGEHNLIIFEDNDNNICTESYWDDEYYDGLRGDEFAQIQLSEIRSDKYNG